MQLEDILSKWNDAKKKITLLEEKIEKYKRCIEKEMNNKSVDKLESASYMIHRRRTTKTYLSKENVPVEVWNKYSSRTSFDTFYLKRKKD